MTVGHYGAHTQSGHPTSVPTFTYPKRDGDDQYQLDQHPKYFKSFFRQIQDIFRFVSEPLNKAQYEESLSISQELDEAAKMKMSDNDFLSYWAVATNSRTNQHTDAGDMHKGIAHVLTLGDYTGGRFFVPELGMSVQYRPGSVGLIRGAELNHFVSEFWGERNFAVGTNKQASVTWNSDDAAARQARRDRDQAEIDEKNAKKAQRAAAKAEAAKNNPTVNPKPKGKRKAAEISKAAAVSGAEETETETETEAKRQKIMTDDDDDDNDDRWQTGVWGP